MNNGGAAFPTKNWQQPAIRASGYSEGMSLRDYFAAKAMVGLIMRDDMGAFNFLTFSDDPVRFALWAYDIADAMLKAREK